MIALLRRIPIVGRWLRPRCSVRGCRAEPIECRNGFTYQGDPPDKWLCPDHAREAGYCPGCGYASGVLCDHDDDPSGLCPSCRDEDEWYEDQLAKRHCRVCGCTDDRACPGGCWWVENDLCSACAPTCSYAGCNEPAIGCRYLGTPAVEPPNEHLCPAHASECGYCCGCGDFCAGIEDFDFSPSGLCEHCRAEVDDDDPGDDFD